MLCSWLLPCTRPYWPGSPHDTKEGLGCVNKASRRDTCVACFAGCAAVKGLCGVLSDLARCVKSIPHLLSPGSCPNHAAVGRPVLSTKVDHPQTRVALLQTSHSTCVLQREHASPATHPSRVSLHCLHPSQCVVGPTRHTTHMKHTHKLFITALSKASRCSHITHNTRATQPPPTPKETRPITGPMTHMCHRSDQGRSYGV